MVEHFHQELCLFGVGAVKQAVIYNEDVLPLFVRERLHENIDDPRRQERSKTLPVCFHDVQEAVQSIKWPILSRQFLSKFIVR